ncbi:Integral membrane protein [Rasamsonia emersonii CBS 393.64]|uniref:Integral membrane protein n=1 Tax=Rasamsonia emersonii (strain ATCC 16479 / CBS 393.64 / IMI 116815) TaxID=1408163 RepID=A0A0F4YVW7_RASE3|nr:Integral membrane protein [Rasamsonia emersonii CBS 393.64]KKA21758.1 Integral membrane protein [Rasamsonia emersonii CBS 393.64]
MEARPPPRPTTSVSVSFSSISFPTVLLLLSTWALSPALAQDVHLLPTAASSTFPACALSCTTLQQAQSGCVPPAAPVSNQATYVSCFCQSALLTSLHTTPDSLWGECWGWHPDNNDCCRGSDHVDHGEREPCSAELVGLLSSPSSRISADVCYSYRIATHWRWVVMLIVLFIGFTTIAIVGMWLKRRYDDKHQGLYHGEDSGLGQPGKGSSAGFLFGSNHNNNNNNNNNNNSPGASGSAISRPEMWGPHQATAHMREIDIAPVDAPSFVASSSRTEVSSANTLVGTGPAPGSPRTATARNSGVASSSGTKSQKESSSE